MESIMRQKVPATPAEFDHTRILERPDGFFWLDKDTGATFGPFATLLAAVEDMEYNAESDFESEDALDEIEDELGLTAWVDPDTGELAEDTMTHLEDH
jgi:hypothetical protein